jgi:hypothetical protein
VLPAEAAVVKAARWSMTTRVGKIALLAVLASLVLVAALSWNMTRGADPALRPKAIAAATQVTPTRRVVKTVVIRRVVPAAGTASSSSATSGASGAVATAAPAPAPVSSGTS